MCTLKNDNFYIGSNFSIGQNELLQMYPFLELKYLLEDNTGWENKTCIDSIAFKRAGNEKQIEKLFGRHSQHNL